MKAILWTKYGSPDGLQLREIEKPTPKDNEVLVKVHAATVTAGDTEMRKLKLPLGLGFPMRIYAGLLKPTRIPILGQEIAGEIVETGKDVTAFKVGDAVFGTTGFRFGGCAEYICLPGERAEMGGTLALKPENIPFEEAAAVPVAGFEAVHFIRAGKVQPGKRVLVVGGAGSIGTFSIQLAKAHGAEVTGVDGPAKQELMRSLGADKVIDYTQGEYTQTERGYDLIIDVVGKRGVARRLEMLKPDGVYFLAFARPFDVLLSRWVAITKGKQLKIESSSQSQEDLLQLKELLEAGKLRSVIGRTFSLEQTAEAHRYAESGQKIGHVAIKVSE